MQPFVVLCTTCKARLKVRDPQAVGQILPCPKCGSMVWVALGAARVAADEPPPAGVPTGAVGAAVRPAALPAEWSATEAFEHLDQLLDPQVPAAPAATSPSPPRRTAKAGAPAPIPDPAPRTAAPDSIVPPPLPVARDGPTEGNAETADTWTFRSLLATRPCLLAAGGLLCGTALAIGVIASTWRGPAATDGPAVAAAEPAAAVQASEPNAASVPTEAAPTEKPAADAAPAVPEETSPSAAAAPAEPAADEPTVAAEPPAEPDDDAVPPPEPTPPPPASVPVDPPVADASETPPAATELSGSGDDELAGFARWLNSATATPVQEAPPSVPQASLEPTDDSAPVLMRPSRSVPPPVDVQARLKDVVPAIEFKDVPLIDVLRTLTQLSTIPVTVDPDALHRRMLSPRTPVNLLRTDAQIADLLDAVLEPLRLGYVVTEGHLLITTQVAGRGELVTIRHDLADLTDGRPEGAAELARWLTQLVAYGTWQNQGGAGTYEVEDAVLVVHQSDTVQYQVLVWCEKLRVARGLPRKSRIPESAVQLETATCRSDALQRPITLRIWQEQNLNQIAARIEQEAQITLLVDWQALLLAGWSPDDQMRLFCQQQPLEAALHSLLDPLGLTYRVIDETVLEITSFEAVAGRNDVEFYRLPAELQTADQVKAVSEQIAQRLGPASFQPTGSGAIAYDLASRTLIVSLPQPLQRQAQEVLSPPPAKP